MSNAVFPALLGQDWSSTKTPMFSTKIQQALSGKELRLSYMTYPLWKFNVGYEVLRSDTRADLQTLMGFFLARQGSFDSFLYSDPNDNTVAAQVFGIGDNATLTFQLIRAYGGFLEPVQALNGAPSIFESDWQGNQLQYATPRTNLYTFSEDLTQAGWAKSGCTITADATAAPDGTTTADKVVESAANVVHNVAQNFTKAASALLESNVVWLKSAGRTFAEIWAHDGAGVGFWAIVNLTTGVVANSGGGTSPSITITGGTNGWWRVEIDQTSNTGTSWQIRVYTNNGVAGHDTPYLGDGVSGIFFWGNHGGQGAALAGSYIKTTTVAVTNTDYTLGSTGIVTMTPAPLNGAILTWTGGFYYRCRFLQDSAEFAEFVNNFWALKKLEFVSVKL